MLIHIINHIPGIPDLQCICSSLIRMARMLTYNSISNVLMLDLEFNRSVCRHIYNVLVFLSYKPGQFLNNTFENYIIIHFL